MARVRRNIYFAGCMLEFSYVKLPHGADLLFFWNLGKPWIQKRRGPAMGQKNPAPFEAAEVSDSGE